MLFCFPQNFKDLSLLARSALMWSKLAFMLDILLSRFRLYTGYTGYACIALFRWRKNTFLEFQDGKKGVRINAPGVPGMPVGGALERYEV